MNAPDVLERLRQCRDPAALAEAIDELCMPFGKVLGITVLCNGAHPDAAMCLIDFAAGNDAAVRCAMHLGGQVFGFNSVTLSFPRPPEFNCNRGVLELTPAARCPQSAESPAASTPCTCGGKSTGR